MKLYSKIFSQLYDPVMHSFEERVLKPKRKFLLKEISTPVLEIGAGTGANFFYYPKDIKITVIEKSEYMIQTSQKKWNHLNIQYFQSGIDDNEIIYKLPKFPSIVSTLVLCSVNDLEKSIKNISQLLEDNGTFYAIEHIQSPNKYYRIFQNSISPVWKFIGDGCHINRNTDVVIKKYFKPIYDEYFFAGVDFYLGKFKKIS